MTSSSIDAPAFVHTPYTKRGMLACKVLLGSNRIAFFDGPPGTGKTTTALEVARLVDRPVAMVTMPARPAPLEVLRRTLEALTGTSGSGTKAQMENDLVAELSDWGGLLIVDEVQNCGPGGIQTLRYLHDRCAGTFAMLLVGWQALKTIQGHPDLESRVIAQVAFEPLTGRDLYDYLFEAYPYLADTPRRILQAVNDQFARGNLREWRNFTEALTVMGMTDTLSIEQADAILNILRVNR